MFIQITEFQVCWGCVAFFRSACCMHWACTPQHNVDKSHNMQHNGHAMPCSDGSRHHTVQLICYEDYVDAIWLHVKTFSLLFGPLRSVLVEKTPKTQIWYTQPSL